MAKKIRGATALTGGGTGAVDAISGSVLADGDVVMAFAGGQVYPYVVDADSGLSESSPNIIAPDTSPGDKRLILQHFPHEIDALCTYGGGVNYTQATIAAALTAIGTVNKTTLLLRPGTWVISSNADWSAYTNVAFKIVQGAVISHSTFTVNIPNLVAGLYRVFSGTGAVTLSGQINGVIPEWFDAKANNVGGAQAVTNSDALTRASAVCSRSHSSGIDLELLLSSGVYQVTSAAGEYAVTINSNMRGQSAQASVIKQIGLGHTLLFDGMNNAAEGMEFRDFSVYGNVAGSGTGITTADNGVTTTTYARFIGVKSHFNGGNGLTHVAAWGTSYIDCKFNDNMGLGVDVGSVNSNAVNFLMSEARHNGGTLTDNSADYTKGGVLVRGASLVNWIGGVVEGNSAWNFLVGDPDNVVRPLGVNISHVFMEDAPRATSASITGGLVKAFNKWDSLSVTNSMLSYGAAAGKVGYGLYIAGDADNIQNQFHEFNNHYVLANAAGTVYKRNLGGFWPGKHQTQDRISTIEIVDGADAAHIKVRMLNKWNGDAHEWQDNIGKDAVLTGVWKLDATGSVLTLDTTGITNQAKAIVSATVFNNSSTTPLTIDPAVSGTTITLTFNHASTGAAQDLATLVDTGNVLVWLAYKTDYYEL